MPGDLSLGLQLDKVVEVFAIAFEIGIGNAALAIVIAQTVLGSVVLSLPAAVYGVLMSFVAAAFAFAIRGRVASPELS